MKKSHLILFAAVVLLCTAGIVWQATAKNTSKPSMPDIQVRLVEEWAAPIDSVMQAGIRTRQYPGGVVCIVRDTGIVFLQAYGNQRVYPDTVPATIHTIYDLASLSKSTGTAMAVHQLAAEGRIDLNDRVDKYLPHFSQHIRNIMTPERLGVKNPKPLPEPTVYETPITIMHLLTHTSGLPSYANTDKLNKVYGGCTPEIVRDYIYHCPRIFEAGTNYTYSCLNFIALQYVIEAVSGEAFNIYVENHVFRPLGMLETGYMPDTVKYRDRIAPTELLKDSTLLFGQVHDPLARVGNWCKSGNAGVFSTAYDLSLLAQFLLQNKDNQFVKTITTVPDSLQFDRTAGWGMKADDIRYMGSLTSAATYGHTGYTGTSMVIDPEHNIAIIILTNHVHPHDKGALNPTRAAIADIVLENKEK